MKYYLLIFSFLFSASIFGQYITAENFRGSKMRGYNFSYVNTYADLANKNLPSAKAQGANHGRIWIGIKRGSNGSYFNYCNYFGNTTNPLPVIDSAVRLAEKIKFPLVLTVEIHPRQGAVDWWGNKARKDSIINVWKMLTTRYKGKAIIAAFDLMNEPRRNTSLPYSVKEYIDFNVAITKAIRAIDPTRVIVIEVLGNSMLGDPYMATIADSTKSTYLKNVVYSPHGYNWIKITHQGAGYTQPKEFPDMTSATYSNVNYFDNVEYWNIPRNFAKKYNAILWFGEFSCINWAPKNHLGQWSSTAWVQAAINWMEKYGFSWAYHAQGEYQGWDARYPSAWYYDPANGVTFSNAKPSKMPPASARTDNSPTMVVLKKYFSLNTVFVK